MTSSRIASATTRLLGATALATILAIAPISVTIDGPTASSALAKGGGGGGGGGNGGGSDRGGGDKGDRDGGDKGETKAIAEIATRAPMSLRAALM